jgi:hypothetical protein
LTMLVRDVVRIDPAIRDIARTQATEILNRAGVELRWVDAKGAEDPHLLSTYVTVVIVKRSPSRWTSLDAMGFAPSQGWGLSKSVCFLWVS